MILIAISWYLSQTLSSASMVMKVVLALLWRLIFMQCMTFSTIPIEVSQRTMLARYPGWNARQTLLCSWGEVAFYKSTEACSVLSSSLSLSKFLSLPRATQRTEGWQEGLSEVSWGSFLLKTKQQLQLHIPKTRAAWVAFFCLFLHSIWQGEFIGYPLVLNGYRVKMPGLRWDKMPCHP